MRVVPIDAHRTEMQYDVYRPTDATDEAWESLYPSQSLFLIEKQYGDLLLLYGFDPSVGLSRISKAESKKLANWTEPIPGDESHYVISLDVFHQIHCLVSSWLT